MSRTGTTMIGRMAACFAACGALLLAIGGCGAHRSGATATLVPAVARPDTAVTAAPYRLVPGDVVDVKFYYQPELNETLTLRPDGFISLQLAGEVRAAGLMPGELAGRLRDRFTGLIRNPEVTVIVRSFAAQLAYVGGQVASPGTVALHGPVTCAQALMERGGARPSGRLSQVILLRFQGGDSAEVRQIDLSRVLDGRESDVVLRPYDVVFVPMTAIARVGQFVEQYINDIVPRSLSFPYQVNPTVTVR